MAIIKCKMCGGDIEISQDKTFGVCECCGSTMTFPKVDDDQRAAAFNRGNYFRRIGEFDKALVVYERIVEEDNTDAEAHWCSALCRYGIEYVEDPTSHEYLPTCHRASFDNFLEDVDYQAALQYSDGITKRQYEKDAAKIAEVQHGILATCQNEQPFDVFICYKESDENGSRTKDSTLAQEIYYQLTDQGRRVFFARITLEDKVGTEYEPYIFAALNSAKVMVVVGTKPEYFNAVWVKNEWSRFLAMMKKDRSKLLLPCYRDMDPYDLPEADVYIMHYLLLRGWKSVLPTLPFRSVIFDEIQELRHAGTEKYSAASLLSESCERVIGLSGTPIYNRGGEIWNVINILDYHFLGDWESFSREWCSGYGNQLVLKPDLLGAYLRREGLMLRRTKQEVLRELPPKRRLVQELDWNDKVYAQLMAPVMRDVLRWKQDDQLSAQERAMLEESISQHARQATGVAKAPYVCQFVRALLDGGEKVLLFAHHHQVMDIYKQELKAFSPGFITGRETTLAKMNAVDRFQSGRTDVLCISLRAASGLNLQRATCVVFGELDWSPAVHSQAEDRAHRMGQEDSLLCYYLVAPQGSDAVMQEALGLKVSQFVGLMGDAPQSPEQAEQFANQARRHVERIVAQMGDNSGSPG